MASSSLQGQRFIGTSSIESFPHDLHVGETIGPVLCVEYRKICSNQRYGCYTEKDDPRGVKLRDTQHPPRATARLFSLSAFGFSPIRHYIEQDTDFRTAVHDLF